MAVLSSYLTSLVKPRHYFPNGALLILSVVFVLIGFIFFTQTQLYLEFRSSPNPEWVQAHMEQSKNLQDKLRKSANLSKPPEPFLDFRERLNQIIAAKEFVVNNEKLEALLVKRFGRSLKQVDVVMVPIWSPMIQDNWEKEGGITDEARWNDVNEAFHQPRAKAVTVRERPGEKQRTVDGIPRIVIKNEAFESSTTLKKTVFHELLHALNLPGYEYKMYVPMWGEVDYTISQDDLCWSPEYRSFVSEASLWEWWDCTPAGGSLVFFLMGVGNIVYLLGRSKFGW